MGHKRHVMPSERFNTRLIIVHVNTPQTSMTHFILATISSRSLHQHGQYGFQHDRSS